MIQRTVHTPGKLIGPEGLWVENTMLPIEISSCNDHIDRLYARMSTNMPRDVQIVNARRLVACWNGCEEAGVVNPKAIPKLIEAAQNLIKATVADIPASTPTRIRYKQRVEAALIELGVIK